MLDGGGSVVRQTERLIRPAEGDGATERVDLCRRHRLKWIMGTVLARASSLHTT
jgi:hypothetical protein